MQDDTETFNRVTAVTDKPEDERDLKESLLDLGDTLKDALERQARELGESALRSTSKRIGAYGDAIRQASESLETNRERKAAGVARRVSETLDRSAEAVENVSAGEAIDYVSKQIKQRPALALGGAFLIGLVLSRLIGAHEKEAQSSPADF